MTNSDGLMSFNPNKNIKLDKNQHEVVQESNFGNGSIVNKPDHDYQKHLSFRGNTLK